MRGIRVTQAQATQAANDGLEMWINPFMGAFIRTDNTEIPIQELRYHYGLNPNWPEQTIPINSFQAVPGVHIPNYTITLAEAAETYGLSYRTLQGAAKDGRLEAWQSGATWLTTHEAVQEAIHADKLQPRISQAK